MKNTLLILVSILMVVFGILAMISSGYEYRAEKLFYRAMKIDTRIARDPARALPQDVAYVEKNLKKLLQQYPKARMVKEAHLALAQLYVNTREYVEALSILFEIINTYSEDNSILSRAYFLRGNAFEKQNQWEKALREYTILRDKYSDSPLALRIPLYIADYYDKQEKESQAEQAYQEAVQFYRKLERENRGQARGYAAANLLMHTYMRLEQYEQAGKVVEDVIDNYPKLLPLAQQMANVELIFLNKLNKSDKTIQLYKKIKTKTADAGLNNILDEKIRALEAQK